MKKTICLDMGQQQAELDMSLLLKNIHTAWNTPNEYDHTEWEFRNAVRDSIDFAIDGYYCYGDIQNLDEITEELTNAYIKRYGDPMTERW